MLRSARFQAETLVVFMFDTLQLIFCEHFTGFGGFKKGIIAELASSMTGRRNPQLVADEQLF